MDKSEVVAALRRVSRWIAIDDEMSGGSSESDIALLRTLADRIEAGEESTEFGTLPNQRRVLIIDWSDQ